MTDDANPYEVAFARLLKLARPENEVDRLDFEASVMTILTVAPLAHPYQPRVLRGLAGRLEHHAAEIRAVADVVERANDERGIRPCEDE